MTSLWMPKRVAVIGSGAWGTTVALLLARNGHEVTLYGRERTLINTINTLRENTEYLPGVVIPSGVTATTNVSDVAGADIVFVAVPTVALRTVLQSAPQVPVFVSLTKGFEHGSLSRPTQIISEVQPQAEVAALSGPNLAHEIARLAPAASTVAAQNDETAQMIQDLLNHPTFRVYRTTDVIGVETAGAVKNIIALAAGISDGLHLGANTKAAIITRGLAELVRFNDYLGGEQATMYGLAGVGDIIATCSSTGGSRNYAAGKRIVENNVLPVDGQGPTLEGVNTTRAVHEYATQQGLSMPITEQVFNVLWNKKSPRAAVEELMARGYRKE